MPISPDRPTPSHVRSHIRDLETGVEEGKEEVESKRQKLSPLQNKRRDLLKKIENLYNQKKSLEEELYLFFKENELRKKEISEALKEANSTEEKTKLKNELVRIRRSEREKDEEIDETVFRIEVDIEEIEIEIEDLDLQIAEIEIEIEDLDGLMVDLEIEIEELTAWVMEVEGADELEVTGCCEAPQESE